MEYEIAECLQGDTFALFNVVVEVDDLEHAGTVLDMFVSFGNFDNITRLAVVDRGGLNMKFGLEWRFTWDSEGVEAAHVKLVDEKGKRAVGLSFDRKCVAGIISADDFKAIIRGNDEGHPELKIMYCPDLVKREKIMSRVIDGVAGFVRDVEAAKVEAESGQ